jgi:RimJ/RimL family protein N-acetyltransferase
MVFQRRFGKTRGYALILAGERERVARWVSSRIRTVCSFGPVIEYEAIGVLNAAGEMIAGVVFYHYTEIAPGQHDIHIAAAGEPGWMKRSNLRDLFNYPFIQLRCARISARTAIGNRRARQTMERLGFQLEGRIRDGYGPGKHAMAYGLLRGDCRWITQEDGYAQRNS